MVSRFLSAGLGCLAFAVAAFAGLAVRNPIEVTLTRALLGMVVFYAIGRLLGGAVELVIAEHVETRRKLAAAATHPPPQASEIPIAEKAKAPRKA